MNYAEKTIGIIKLVENLDNISENWSIDTKNPTHYEVKARDYINSGKVSILNPRYLNKYNIKGTTKKAWTEKLYDGIHYIPSMIWEDSKKIITITNLKGNKPDTPVILLISKESSDVYIHGNVFPPLKDRNFEVFFELVDNGSKPIDTLAKTHFIYKMDKPLDDRAKETMLNGRFYY